MSNVLYKGMGWFCFSIRPCQRSGRTSLKATIDCSHILSNLRSQIACFVSQYMTQSVRVNGAVKSIKNIFVYLGLRRKPFHGNAWILLTSYPDGKKWQTDGCSAETAVHCFDRAVCKRYAACCLCDLWYRRLMCGMTIGYDVCADLEEGR